MNSTNNLDYIYKKYYESKISKEKFDLCLQVALLACGNNIARGYLAWLIKIYENTSLERIAKNREEIALVLSLFNRVKKRLPIKKRDINTYKNLEDIKNTIKLAPSGRKEIKRKGASLISENEEMRVIKITTYESMCLYGGQTRWCVKNQEVYRSYELDAKGSAVFYLFLDKTKKTRVLLNLSYDYLSLLDKYFLYTECSHEDNTPINAFEFLLRLDNQIIKNLFRKEQLLKEKINIVFETEYTVIWETVNNTFCILDRGVYHEIDKLTPLCMKETYLLSYLPQKPASYMRERVILGEAEIIYQKDSLTILQNRKNISLYVRKEVGFTEYKNSEVFRFLRLSSLYKNRVDMHHLYNNLKGRIKGKIFYPFVKKRLMPYCLLEERENCKIYFIAPIPKDLYENEKDRLSDSFGKIGRIDEIYRERFWFKGYYKIIFNNGEDVIVDSIDFV